MLSIMYFVLHASQDIASTQPAQNSLHEMRPHLLMDSEYFNNLLFRLHRVILLNSNEDLF